MSSIPVFLFLTNQHRVAAKLLGRRMLRTDGLHVCAWLCDGATIAKGKLLDVADGSEHLFRAGAYADIFGEILPAHHAGAIDQKLCWAGDVVAIGSPRDVQQIVTADYV